MQNPSPITPRPAMPVRQDWLDRHRETILEPELPIVDPHHHLWERADSRYMLPELLADTNSGHSIIGTVFVEWAAMFPADGPAHLRAVRETEFVSRVADLSASGAYGPTKACAGIIGHADLALGAAVDEILVAHIRAGNGRFVGIRHNVSYVDDPAIMAPDKDRPPGLMAQTQFREGFARLAPNGLVFDAMLYHPQIDELTALARAFPGTKIVLNHVGCVLAVGSFQDRRKDIFTGWARAIRDLGKCPNVFCKLGGLGMRFSGFEFQDMAEPPSSATLATAWRPYIETCIEAFGADRCMFESNFPVDKASYSYPVFWNACKILARGASETEKNDLFSRTAIRTYDLKL